MEPTRGYLLISIDTLSASHLGTYGYPLETSPFLDSLAERGVLFEKAFVQLPGTLPSHMSIFTGMYPVEHGVYPPAAVLAEGIPTLPELFRDAGFQTAGYTEGGYVAGTFGFDRGFDHFSDEVDHVPQDIEKTFARGLEFLDGLGSSDPFFLFLHSYTVHDPYFPPEPFKSEFWPQEPLETVKPTGPNLSAFNRGEISLSAAEVEYFEKLYDAGIAYMDSQLGRLFEQLDQRGLLDETTVVITSDHGEEFLEHGKLAHEQIYPETLHVPLLIIHPQASSGSRVSSVVQSIDIAPTLLDIARIAPPPSVSGSTLVPYLLGQSAGTGTTYSYAESADRQNRSICVARDDLYVQLIQFTIARDRRRAWISRSVAFETVDPEVGLRVRSYHRPRELMVEVDGELVGRFEIIPDRAADVGLDLAADGAKRSVRLFTEGCDSPADVGSGDDTRCLSFSVTGADLWRSELFDLAVDPEARQDLSRARADLEIRLRKQLNSLGWSQEAATLDLELDAQLVEDLKALGYLQ